MKRHAGKMKNYNPKEIVKNLEKISPKESEKKKKDTESGLFGEAPKKPYIVFEGNKAIQVIPQ